MYPFIKKCLFALDAEKSHHLAMRGLQIAHKLKLLSLQNKSFTSPCNVMNLSFPNRIGLAAGLDKNAEYIDALAALGFGFIEIGTVTPKPQPGEMKPRLFRLQKEEAIINRMGFNSKGVQHVKQRLERTQYRGIIGINLGKNKETPIERAADDYLYGFRELWPYAAYITINISSPNTPQLRNLQQADKLEILLRKMKQEQARIQHVFQRYVPLVIKISPDLTDDALRDIADIFMEQKIDGVITANTTLQRDGVQHNRYASERGGLSGKPLCQRNTALIQKLYKRLKETIPIIASGGIMDVASAQEKRKAGATLLQIYSGFIYRGPRLIRELIDESSI